MVGSRLPNKPFGKRLNPKYQKEIACDGGSIPPRRMKIKKGKGGD